MTIAIAYTGRFKKGGIFPFAFLLFCAFLGALHSKNYLRLPQNHIARLNTKTINPIRISGVIDTDPAYGARKIGFILRAREITAGNRSYSVQGKVLANLYAQGSFSYGDELILEGSLHKPFSFGNQRNLSYRDYLRNQGVYSLLSVRKENKIAVSASGKGNYFKSQAFRMKHGVKSIFERSLWPVNSAVLSGIILGERQNIPDVIRQGFIRTGTSHIIAISGFNVGIVVFMFLILLKALGIKRRLRYALAIPLLIIHMLAVGASSSVVRATIMALAVLAGYLLEREADIINGLSLSALIILGYNPMQLFDAGFQLSFASVLGIVLLSPKIVNLFENILDAEKSPESAKNSPAPAGRQKLLSKILLRLGCVWRFCVNGFAVSFSAWLVTFGFTAYYFRIISPITVAANLVIVPLTSLIILLGFSLAASAPIAPVLAVQIASATNFLMALLFKITLGLSSIPFASFYL